DARVATGTTTAATRSTTRPPGTCRRSARWLRFRVRAERVCSADFCSSCPEASRGLRSLRWSLDQRDASRVCSLWAGSHLDRRWAHFRPIFRSIRNHLCMDNAKHCPKRTIELLHPLCYQVDRVVAGLGHLGPKTG